MPLSVLVTNQPSITDDNVPQPSLKLFHEYYRATGGQAYSPFQHQAQAFRLITEDQEAFMVAGTAAGKTLAIAIPLFHKLKTGRIRKVLLMYPTIALMEDQRLVMDRLAKITGLEVGQLQGGMSRTKLISALNKPVILATPDEVYWFFRKNVKYSGLLIYGLALVDEFVLDEAHLFNGLMLRNFEHLWQRVKVLANCLGKSPRLHILTATPSDDLKRLSGAQTIPGKSKCNDVRVEFRPCGRFDRADQIADAVSAALASGQHKVLVVCNSARMAHQLFEQYKVSDTSTIPVEHRLRFGKAKLGDLVRWLEKTSVGKELVEEVSARLVREEDVVLADVPGGTTLSLSLQDIVAHTTEVLERQCWQVKRALWENKQRTGETLQSLLSNRPLPCCIVTAVHNCLERETEVEKQQAILDEWLADTVERLSNVTDETIRCEAREFAALTEAFVSAGLDEQLAALLTKRLSFEMKADSAQLPARSLSHRPVYLRWLDWMVEDDKAHRLREAVKSGLESDELDVECRHIGLWKGADVPVIVYSGSMAKQAREGLINVFADLDRAVLISTSAVEVGVDFHADTLITEECEGNSFLQRFGRVGRHGTGSEVIVFVSGDVCAMLNALDQTEISREDFSSKILTTFPRRTYATRSQLLDASHYLVNEQLGRIGEKLNAIPDLVQAKPIAEQLRTASIQLNFGLRSTAPQITLRDGVTKDPFYLLRYVDDEDLRPADSPFEVARATTWFTSLIFQRAQFDVTVDLEETLKASQHLFILQRGQPNPRVFSSRGIGFHHLCGLLKSVPWDKNQSFYYLLLHGDVYLSRSDRETPHPEPVRDREQNPLFIPNQTYMVLWGWTDSEAIRALFEGAGIADWEELQFDWDRLKQDWNKAMVILENTTGACFAAYKELLDHVGLQIQE
jgi:DEAD/DEAH box helicase domain-containing protein